MAGEKILVVEDSLDILSLLTEEVLPYHGYQAIGATSGHDGLKKLASEKPDLLLVDLELGDMSGMDILKAIKGDDRAVPVILMTAYGSESIAVEAFRLGVRDYIIKPFSTAEALDVIDRTLTETRLRRETEQLTAALQQRVQQLTTLSAVGKSVASLADLEGLLNRIVEAGVYVTKAEEGFLLLIDPDTDDLYLRAGKNLGEEQAQGFRVKVDDSLVGEVVRTGRPARRGGEGTGRDFAVKTGYLVKSLLHVPLSLRDRVIGVLSVDNKVSDREFTEDDEYLLSALADHAAIGIENATLVDEVQHRLEELGRLYRVATDMVGALDLDQVLRTIVETAQQAIPSSSKAMIHLLDQESGLLVPRVASDPESDPSLRASMSLGEGIAGLAAQERRSIYVPDTRQDPHFIDLGTGLGSLLVVPLLMREMVIGTLTVDSTRADAFDRNDERMLTTLASQATIAIDNARLYEEIKASEERYRSMVEHASDAICLVDMDGWRFLEVNPQMENLIGHGLEELMEMTASDVRFARDDLQEEGTFEELLCSGGTGFEGLSVVRRDGRLVPVSISISQVPSTEGQFAQVILRDVSARKKMEEQLIHTEKLAALGRLAASLAHEINNPLQAIRSSISLLAKRPLDESKREQFLSVAGKEVERLIQLVQRTIDFYRPSKERWVQTDVNALLEDTLALSSKQLQHSGVKIRKELGAQLPAVEALPNYLKQVFINIVLNAVEAMPDGGELTVGTGFDLENEELVIAFRDTGVGIPSRDLPYVFEPFYTTKERGTGLGLAISYSIVERHGGRIDVESKGGKGTTFTVRLPLIGGEHG